MQSQHALNSLNMRTVVTKACLKWIQPNKNHSHIDINSWHFTSMSFKVQDSVVYWHTKTGLWFYNRANRHSRHTLSLLTCFYIERY